MARIRRCECQRCISKHGCHLRRLGLPIGLVALDYAKSVNPEVPKPEFSGCPDTVLKSPGQSLVADEESLLSRCVILRCGFDGGRLAPAVAKGDI